jgi:hypothetical protein
MLRALATYAAGRLRVDTTVPVLVVGALCLWLYPRPFCVAAAIFALAKVAIHSTPPARGYPDW